MAKLVKEYNPVQPAEECLIYMIEWVGDWNGQFMVTDFTTDEYKDAIAEIEDFSKRFIRLRIISFLFSIFLKEGNFAALKMMSLP